jgi:hypothetical protein
MQADRTKMMHAALNINMLDYNTAIGTTKELVPLPECLGSWRRADALGHDCAVIPMSNGPRVRCRL